MKYEEAYCSAENKTLTLDEIAYIFANDTERYACKLEGNLFCPGCRKVPLAFVNAKRPHFRGYPNVDHENGCIHTKDEMNPSEVKNLLDSPAGETEILHQMDRLLIQFLRNNSGCIGSDSILHPGKITDDDNTLRSKRWKSNKVIPRKQINAPFTEDDYGVEKIFYGQGHIKWEAARTGDRQKLLVWGITTGRLICRLGLTNNVYKHLPQRYTQEQEYDAFVVFMTSLKKQDSEKSWSQGNLRKSFFLCINKLNPSGK